MGDTFADLDTMISRVDTDIDDTRFVLGNTRAELPGLRERLHDSEATSQLALTDSDEEGDTVEQRAIARAALVRHTVKQRQGEADKLAKHLDSAEDYKQLLVATKREREEGGDEDRLTKRMSVHEYTPAKYDFS